jgi:glutathione synthase
MRDLLFVVNELTGLTAIQTTAEFIAEAHRQGHRCWVTPWTGLSLTPRGLSVAASAWPGGPASEEVLSTLRAAPWRERAASSFDAIWVRTNPGRATRPGMGWLQLLFQLEDQGIVIRNSPAGLLRAASKLHLGSLPVDTIARTWSSEDPERLGRFLDELAGPAVVKPAMGTRGSGVTRIWPDSANRAAILAEATRDGPALLQDYLPEAPAGDVRIHVVAGELLEADGQACAVLRVPGEGEWRSNVALGGTPTRTVLTGEQRALVRRVGPVLAAQGLWHAGLDVVGDKIVECNVFSPGGIGDASRFTGVDFARLLVSRFVESL